MDDKQQQANHHHHMRDPDMDSMDRMMDRVMDARDGLLPEPGLGPMPGMVHHRHHHQQPPPAPYFAHDARKHSPAENRSWRSYVPTKASTEFDSENAVFVNKLSTTLLDGLAKLKLSFERGPDGVTSPLLGLVTKHLSVLYDTEDVNALVTLSGNLGRNLHLKYLHDIKSKQGEVQLRTHGFNNMYRANFAYELPPTGTLPKASFGFPHGEFKIEEELREDEETGEEYRALSFGGFLGGRVMGGLLEGRYAMDNFSVKYTYKDAEMTLMPSFNWPQKNLALVFKRQFNHANKLSYRYNFDSTNWSGVYKYQLLDSLKVKFGYDSEAQLGWGSLWVGKENAGAKQAPRKCKLQIMLQVPQENPRSAVVLFRIKKRWDLY